MDDDDWQEMPVVGAQRHPQSASHDDDDRSDAESSSSSSGHRPSHWSTSHRRRPRPLSDRYESHPSSTTTTTTHNANATGRSLHVKDARGYDWRAKPSGAPGMHSSRKDEFHSDDDDWKIGSSRQAAHQARETDSEESDDEDEAGKGYTQLRLDEDVEGDELHAATEYLFGGPGAGGGPHGSTAAGANDPSRSGPIESSVGYSYQSESTATPLSQMMTTKALLSEPQKIAYVGLCSITAKEMLRAIKRVPGASKDLAESVKSMEEWQVKVMARLFQHMDIDVKGE